MTREAAALRDYMSDLSEEAWYAGWQMDLEYALWNAVEHGPRSYGRLHITEQHIAKLRELSAACGDWIQFADDAREEEFVPLDAWKRRSRTRGRSITTCRITSVEADERGGASGLSPAPGMVEFSIASPFG